MFKAVLTWLVGGIALAAAGSTQAFPDKAVTIIMPFPAGAATDVTARDFAQLLAGVVKQPVLVDNRVGAEGTIAGLALVNAPADGHTVMFTSSSLPVLDPLMKKSMPYDVVRDFTPICAVARTSMVLNVTGASPYKTVADLIGAAKAQPGKLTYAYSSTSTRLAAELFQQITGIRLTAVPYKSSVTALTEVGSGQVDMMFIDHNTALPFAQSGKARMLVVAGAQRIKSLPDVPPAAETAARGFNMTPWYGIYAPARTPAPVVAQLREAVAQAMKMPAMASNLEKRSLEPMPICGDAFARFQADDIALWQGVIRKAGIEPQ